MIRLGMTAKFLICITVAITIIQIGGGLASVFQNRKAMEHQSETFAQLMTAAQRAEAERALAALENKQETMAQVLGEIAATYIVGSDYESLGSLATTAAKEEYIAFVTFYGTNGSPLTPEIATAEGIKTYRHQLAVDGSPIGSLVIGTSRASVDRLTAVSHDNLNATLSEVQAEQSQTVWRLFFWSASIGVAGLIILASLTWFLLSRIVIRPVTHVVRDLGESSATLARTSRHVAAASESLSDGTASQASALQQTVASLEDLAARTKQNVVSADQANSETAKVRDAALRGQDAMERMGEAIKKIKSSSDQTSRIIKTIDEIAFQTNLLALNAAVEAARAGDAGRGFAVVAEEVRNLAQRSADAARSTSGLIDESQANAEHGVAMATEVSTILGEIGERVQSAAGLVEEMNTAASEQSSGIDQINSAIGQIDNVTQSNSASAEESAAASHEMTGLAADLEKMVTTLQEIIGSGGRAAPAPKPVSVATPPVTARDFMADLPFVESYQSNLPPIRERVPEMVIPLGEDDF